MFATAFVRLRMAYNLAARDQPRAGKRILGNLSVQRVHHIRSIDTVR
jgi:hypothetical protein